MLTYYHYLLGGLFAATCATSTLVGSLAGSTASISPARTLSLSAEAGATETVDVSYRGSGRIDDAPKEQQNGKKKLVAHRGSGRVYPSAM